MNVESNYLSNITVYGTRGLFFLVSAKFQGMWHDYQRGGCACVMMYHSVSFAWKFNMLLAFPALNSH